MAKFRHKAPNSKQKFFDKHKEKEMACGDQDYLINAKGVPDKPQFQEAKDAARVLYEQGLLSQKDYKKYVMGQLPLEEGNMLSEETVEIQRTCRCPVCDDQQMIAESYNQNIMNFSHQVEYRVEYICPACQTRVEITSRGRCPREWSWDRCNFEKIDIDEEINAL